MSAAAAELPIITLDGRRWWLRKDAWDVLDWTRGDGVARRLLTDAEACRLVLRAALEYDDALYLGRVGVESERRYLYEVTLKLSVMTTCGPDHPELERALAWNAIGLLAAEENARIADLYLDGWDLTGIRGLENKSGNLAVND